MPRVQTRFVKFGVEYTYLTHCCGYTRKEIAEQYGVPTKNVSKLSSYRATFWREVEKLK